MTKARRLLNLRGDTLKESVYAVLDDLRLLRWRNLHICKVVRYPIRCSMVSGSRDGGGSMYDSGDIRWSSARTTAKARCPLNWRYSMVVGSYDGEGSMSADAIYCCVSATLLYEAHNLLTCGLIGPMDIGRVEIARIAVGLVQNDYVSARRMTDQARTKMCR